jgi:hypothetical protein
MTWPLTPASSGGPVGTVVVVVDGAGSVDVVVLGFERLVVVELASEADPELHPTTSTASAHGTTTRHRDPAPMCLPSRSCVTDYAERRSSSSPVTSVG